MKFDEFMIQQYKLPIKIRGQITIDRLVQA
jgi:hypothetical protein